MSEETPIVDQDAEIIAEAAADFEAYRKAFEERFGYGIGVSINLLPNGNATPVLQLFKLVKLPDAATSPELSADDLAAAGVTPEATPSEEVAATEPTPDANTETETTSPSDSPEQPESEAAQ